MRTAIIVFIVAVVAAIGWRYFSGESQSTRPQNAPAVVLYTVKQELLEQKIEALGTTQALKSIDVTSKITERVKALPMREGELVEKGAVLIELENAQELAQLEAAKIELREHKREYNRIEDLVRKKQIPSSELDQRQSLIDLAETRIAEVTANLNYRTIRAPFRGTLGLRNISVGALAKPGDVLTTLDAIDRLHVDFTVPEKHLSKLQAGKPVIATSIAFPNKTFKGTVETVAPRINAVSRSVTVRAQLDNKELLLKPGMLLQMAMIEDSRNALLIPEEAVLMRGDQHFVYVVGDDKIAREVAIDIGLRHRGQVEVLSGVNPGQNIVQYGLLKIRPNSPVNIQHETWRTDSSSGSSTPSSKKQAKATEA